VSEGNSQQDAGDDIGNDLHTVVAVEPKEVISDSRQDPFPHSNDSQRSSKVLFGIALIIEKERERRI